MTDDPRLPRVMPCPWCGEPNDAASDAEGSDARPEPGDASLCFTCGCWAIFESDHQRKPTEAEAADLARDAHCQRMVAAWNAFPRRKRNNA